MPSLPFPYNFPPAAVIPYSEIVASCTKSIGLWRSPTDIASETPILRSMFPSLPNSSACRGSLAHHPIFLSGILFRQAARLCHCCCRAGLHHTQRRKGEESRHQSLLKMFVCMAVVLPVVPSTLSRTNQSLEVSQVFTAPQH